MHPKSLPATALLSLSLTSVHLTSICTAQDKSAPSTEPAAIASPSNGDNKIDGLPPFLLEVPAGKAQIGLPVDEFVQAAAEAAFEFNPEAAPKAAKDKFIQNMRRTAAALGNKEVEVPAFFLGKAPVTNRQYLIYVDRLRKAGKKVLPPYHWWRYGREDSYNEHLPKIRKAFPDMEEGPVLYWERHGHELPYKVADDLLDHPVTFVSYRTATIFAANLGMRLPTETELTRAMRADGNNVWPLGAGDDPEKDKYTSELLKALGMSSSSDYHTKPVGSNPNMNGPFGHTDMFGNVWQLAGNIGLEPLHGMEAFLETWEDLQKHKIGRMLDKKPHWQVDKAIARGGCYLSYGEPIQLMIDARAPMQTTDVLAGLGFRLAKSYAPGYDFIYSLQRVEFSSSVLDKDQELNLDLLVGGERYEFDETGFPSTYEAVAFTPVNWITAERSMRRKDLAENSQTRPVLIGALASSIAFGEGIEPGMYAVQYRAAGITKELLDATKRGHKDVVKARKEAAKAAEKGKEVEAEVSKYAMIARKYGLTEDDLADTGAVNGDLGYVRIDGVQIPTDIDTFLLIKGGKVVGVLRGTKRDPVGGDLTSGKIEVQDGGKDHQGKAMVQFKVAVPLLQRKADETLVFELPVPLDIPAPTEDKKWRLTGQDAGGK